MSKKNKKSAHLQPSDISRRVEDLFRAMEINHEDRVFTYQAHTHAGANERLDTLTMLVKSMSFAYVRTKKDYECESMYNSHLREKNQSQYKKLVQYELDLQTKNAQEARFLQTISELRKKQKVNN
ncbi:hypothetical protein KW787_00425 [Candidatus Pacearchaeota archaeon]|nr:hypothetical protein [Candidatus Pacearchaeota archaeon]